MLNVENLHVAYGGIRALKGVSLRVDEGEIVTIIGANGAGKSTLLNAISGFLKPSSGSVSFRGKPLSRRPDLIVRDGICHVPEGRLVFANLSVESNLAMGAYLRSDKKAIAADLERVYALFPRLAERAKQSAGTLSGGEQQMLAMGRALMTDGELVLMDEPSLGLSPIMCQEIAKIIRQIHEMGRTIVLVEQNARLALSLAQRAYVMETGKVVLEGPAKDLSSDPNVQKSYLGLT